MYWSDSKFTIMFTLKIKSFLKQLCQIRHMSKRYLYGCLYILQVICNHMVVTYHLNSEECLKLLFILLGREVCLWTETCLFRLTIPSLPHHRDLYMINIYYSVLQYSYVIYSVILPLCIHISLPYWPMALLPMITRDRLIWHTDM